MPLSKKRLIICGCFLFILYIQVLSSWGLESFSTLENEGSKLSKRFMQDQEVHARVDGDLNGDCDEKGYIRKQKTYESEKSQRGKGAYGGANIAHRPRATTRSAASLLAKPPIFISTLICFIISFALMIHIFPFPLLQV
ncbi:hypothetical protein CMV_016836 [Castanea mollissima]|uniref:Transmembrane protein n=1 Tax=Castanea mollissima TaxID=60419 RepID=A0A8J4R7F8_9ROSI|nr:hypothetical protein CMV_016836 [Castanea mollissima]